MLDDDTWNCNALQLIAVEYESTSDEENIVSKRCKRKYDSRSKMRQTNFINRMKGRQYLGFSTSDAKINQDIPKPQRKMGPECSSTFCLNSTLRKCQQFEEDDRKNIFENFWKLSWEAKKVFVKHHVSELAKKSNSTDNRKRENTFIYKLPYKCESVQVCKFMFLSTLSINRGMVRGWVVDRVSSPVISNQQGVTDSERIICKSFLTKYLQNLERVESHYCHKRPAKVIWLQLLQQKVMYIMTTLINAQRKKLSLCHSLHFQEASMQKIWLYLGRAMINATHVWVIKQNKYLQKCTMNIW